MQISENSIKFYSANGIDNMGYSSFKINEKNILLSIRDSAINGTYKFSRYKEKLLIKDRHSTPRCISIPTLKDKVCLKALQEVINEYYYDLDRMPLPQECIKTLVNSVDKYDYFIKIDITNFYGSINHYKLFNILGKKIKDVKILDLIKKAIETPIYPDITKNITGVHQGIPISNILAHVYLSELDDFFINMNNICYVRYVDDILILCREEEKNVIKHKLMYELQRNSLLTTNEKKFNEGKLIETTFQFLGYSTLIDKDKGLLFSVKPSGVRKIENRLINNIIKYKNSKKDLIARNTFLFETNLIISGSISCKVNNTSAISKRYGWLFFYSQITDLSILYHLDSVLNKKIKEKFSNEEQLYILKHMKSFVRAYYEVKYNSNNTEYIFRPDKFTTEQQKKFLKETYGIDCPIDAEQIDKLFRKYVYKKIKQNEQDTLEGVS